MSIISDRGMHLSAGATSLKGEDETLDTLFEGKLKLFQARSGYRFSLDALLLAYFMHAYTESWKLGLKAVAIYRDGSKRTQPLNTSKDKEEKKAAAVEGKESRPFRRKLPDERRSFTHKFDIAGHGKC